MQMHKNLFINGQKQWEALMKENAKARQEKAGRPIAQLAEFLRTSDKISNKD